MAGTIDDTLKDIVELVETKVSLHYFMASILQKKDYLCPRLIETSKKGFKEEALNQLTKIIKEEFPNKEGNLLTNIRERQCEKDNLEAAFRAVNTIINDLNKTVKGTGQLYFLAHHLKAGGNTNIW